MFVLISFSSFNILAQASLPVSRTGWGTTPTGWTDNQGTSPTYGTDICSGSGSSSGRLDNAGENFILFYNGPASSLVFCVRGNTGSGAFSGTFLIQESTDGTSWSSGQSVPVTTSAATNTIIVDCNSRYIRFLFSVKSNGNIQIDNVSLTTGTCTSCTAPTTTLSVLSQTVCSGSANTMSVSTNASSPSYTWQASANGTSGWNTATNNTPAGSSYSGVNTSVLSLTAASTYYYRVLVSESGTCTATSSTSTLVVNTPVTITTQPISVSTTSTGTASYTVLATGTGNTYQWQQNSGSGFTNILNGGTNPTYAGATSSVLTISNPPLSMSGYSYQCIVSNPCATVTTSGTSTITVTTALTCPYLISAVINSCDGCADEGNNEFLVLNTGSYSFVVNSSNVKITYSNGSTNITSSFAAQPTSLATLNTSTINACGTTFVDVSSGATTVPANSTLLILNKGACFTGDWSDYCGLGTVYVAFSSTTDWITGGFFGNNSTARFFETDFSAINGSCGVTTYAYNQPGIAGTPFSFGSDGASVVFNNGAPPSYINGNGNCAPPNIILPIELIDFYIIPIENRNQIIWKVVDEINIKHYDIEKSHDGLSFEKIATVYAQGEVYKITDYSFLDDDIANRISYYRLKIVDIDEQYSYSKIISTNSFVQELPKIYSDANQLIIDNAQQSMMYLFDLSGKEILSAEITESRQIIPFNQNMTSGVFFVRFIYSNKVHNQKIIISN